MNFKIWILVVIGVLLTIFSILILQSRNEFKGAFLTSVIYNLETVELLANQNADYLNMYKEGDESISEKILYNHMVILDNINVLESLDILRINKSVLLRSTELLDAKAYIDRLSVEDKYVNETLINYYNKLIKETSAINVIDIEC